MRQVLVRFAGMVAPEVRRRAQSIGSRVLAGTSKTSVFQGYIISAKGMKDRTIVNVIELPMWYSGIPNYVTELDMGIGVPGIAPRAELVNPKPREPGSSGGGREAARSVGVYYFGKSWSVPDGLANTFVNFLADYHAAGDVRVAPAERTVGLAAVRQVNKEQGDQLPNYRGSFQWRASSVSLVDYLELQVIAHANKNASIYIESGYLSLQYGSRVRLLGMPNRLREIDADVAYCYPGTPTPAPRWAPYRPGDGVYYPNPRPFTYTCEAPGARPQHCHPAFERQDSRSVVAFPCVSLPEGWDVLDLEGWDPYAVDDPVDPARYRRANISASSLAFGHSGSQGGLDNPYPGVGGVSWDAIGYGSPLLCVLGIQHRQPLTAAEVEAWEPLGYPPSVLWNRAFSDYLPAGQYRQGSRYVLPTVGADQVADADAIVEGAEFPSIAATVFVELADLPEWIQPATLQGVYGLLEQTQHPDDRVVVNPFEITVHSGQRLSCTFGDPKITLLDGVAEVVFPVCSRDASLVEPVNPRQDGQPNLALVCQTKVALAVARFAIGEDGSASRVGDCALMYQDLIGPARSELMPADADPDTARIPTLLWSGVMDGKRVYLARALRYIRDEYLGGMEQVERLLSYTREMLDDLGYPSLAPGRYHTSAFEDHIYDELEGYTAISRNYRPMVDKAQLEELWLIVDGVRTIIPMQDNQLLLPRIFGDLIPYYFGEDRPRNGYYGPDKIRWLVTEAERTDPALAAARGRMHEEAIGYGAVFNTIARITDTDVVVLLHAPEGTSAGAAYSFMRVNCATGEHTILSTVQAGAPELQIGAYQSLNCYQWEVERDGEVVQEACLMWRSGRTDGTNGSAQVHFSIDGGRTWVGNVLSHLNIPPTGLPSWGMVGLGLYVNGPSMKDPSSPLFYRKPA